MKNIIHSTAFILILFSMLSYAQQNTEGKFPLIQKLNWLEGAFAGEAWGGIIEETWSAPVGNNIIGMYRHIKNNEVVFSELMYITERNDSLILRLKHFTGELIGWEEKEKFVEFPFVELKDDEIIFDGLKMKRLGENSFSSKVMLRDKDTGGTKEMEFIYTKIK